MVKSGYDFYLNKCLLPVAPGKLQIKINNANKTVTLINQGQINLLKVPELTEIEFECLIPQTEYPFAVYKSGFLGASYFLNYFESLKTSRKPFQFIVSRRLLDGETLFGTNMKVSMEDYQITEDAEEGFDLTVKIRLKQFREYGIKTVSIKNIQETQVSNTSQAEVTVSQTRAAENSPAPSTTRTHTFSEGETLWELAKKYYGDGSKYGYISAANRDRIEGNMFDIKPGQVLTIPAI